MPRSAQSRLSPRKKPRQERAQRTVDCLLDATARVLVARGWASTTTNHVAKRAGVSVGTLYEYFPCKEALVSTLVERHLDEAELRLAAFAQSFGDSGLTLETLVRAMVVAMIELHERSPRLHRVLFDEVPHGPAVRRRVRALEDAYARALSASLRRFLPLRDADVKARVIVELLETLTHRWVVTFDAELLPRDRMQVELERLVLSYVRAG